MATKKKKICHSSNKFILGTHSSCQLDPGCIGLEDSEVILLQNSESKSQLSPGKEKEFRLLGLFLNPGSALNLPSGLESNTISKKKFHRETD